jgi:hypothetical protein
MVNRFHYSIVRNVSRSGPLGSDKHDVDGVQVFWLLQDVTLHFCKMSLLEMKTQVDVWNMWDIYIYTHTHIHMDLC